MPRTISKLDSLKEPTGGTRLPVSAAIHRSHVHIFFIDFTKDRNIYKILLKIVCKRQEDHGVKAMLAFHGINAWCLKETMTLERKLIQKIPLLFYDFSCSVFSYLWLGKEKSWAGNLKTICLNAIYEYNYQNSFELFLEIVYVV